MKNNKSLDSDGCTSPTAPEGAGPDTGMHKIAIIGSSGSGKSTFAKGLSRKLKLPLFHLDSLYWKPNWEKTDKITWIALQEKLVQESKWIIDGNYNSTLDIRIRAADTIFFLNFSRITCISGVLMRFLAKKRVDVIVDCKERLSLEFLLWIWNYPRKNAPKMIDALQKHASTKRIYIFENRRELNEFFDELQDD
jgi:adenylate kinase family enzyme